MWQTIDEMPLKSFISVLVNKEYTKLYEGHKFGLKYDENNEIRQWNELYAEYTARLMGNDTSSLENPKKIVQLTAKARVLASLVILIHDKGVDDFKRIARFYGCRLTGNEQNDISLLSAEFDNAMRMLKKALANAENRSEGSGYTWEYFTEILTSMSAHFKIALDMNMTVGAYCSYYNRMKQDIKMVEKQNKKHQYGR